MKRGESRFFLNWQLSKADAAALHQSKTDKERTALLEKWVSRNSGLVSVANVDDEAHWSVLLNYFEGHFDVARKAKFTALKCLASSRSCSTSLKSFYRRDSQKIRVSPFSKSYY